MQPRKITQTELLEALRRCRRKGGLVPRRPGLTAAKPFPVRHGGHGA